MWEGFKSLPTDSARRLYHGQGQLLLTERSYKRVGPGMIVLNFCSFFSQSTSAKDDYPRGWRGGRGVVR